jgi:hypothetical protein
MIARIFGILFSAGILSLAINTIAITIFEEIRTRSKL